MSKELIFVHDWVGPCGPVHNHKVPDIYDLTKRIPYAHTDRSMWCTDEVDPLVMDLKNFAKCRVVPSYDLSSIQGKTFFYELQLSQRTNFTTVSLTPGIGFFENAAVSQEVLSAVRMNQGYILLTCILESFFEDEVFVQIYNYFRYHNIPLYRVIYLTNCANAEEVHADFCQRYGYEPELKCEYVGLYLLNQTGLVLHEPGYENRKVPHPTKTNKEKLFLNLNRRLRLHRYLFLLKMYEQGLLEKCLMSFSKEYYDINKWVGDLRELCERYNISLTDQDLERLYDKMPMILDTDNFNRFPMEDDLLTTADLYDRTAISVISETNFENNIIHMTEKTIKPILFKQPFIVVGPAGTLKKLKAMGFKTFSEFWDESYDDEHDYKKRMEKIVDVCKTIAEWDAPRLNTLYFRTAQIVNYNFNQFKNYQKVELNSFIEKYGNEI